MTRAALENDSPGKLPIRWRQFSFPAGIPSTSLPLPGNFYGTFRVLNILYRMAVTAVFSAPPPERTCTSAQIARYRSRISGPLLERIDIHVEVPAVPFRDFSQNETSELSSAIKDRIAVARKIQDRRFKGTGIHWNVMMSGRQIKQHCKADARTTRYLGSAGRTRLRKGVLTQYGSGTQRPCAVQGLWA